VVLVDRATKTKYNLYFSGKRPSVNTGIHFVGKVHKGATICMEGIAIDVKNWSNINLGCSIPGR
jgi:hypothetical protein